MKKATLQTIARDVRAIARSVAAAPKPANQEFRASCEAAGGIPSTGRGDRICYAPGAVIQLRK